MNDWYCKQRWRWQSNNEDLKTFAIANKNNEYCAHCGLWYSTGDTVYVEPILTVPEHRRQGLAKAVIFKLDSHFPQKCMIGWEIIKQNGTNYASW